MKRARNILVGLFVSVLLVATVPPPRAFAQFVSQPPKVQAVRLSPVWRVEEREQQYTVRRPVYETTVREARHKVLRPVYETSEREEPYTVRRAVLETTEREVATTVYEPVIGQRAIPLCWRRWITRPVTSYVPRVNVRKVPVQTVRYVDEQGIRKVAVRTVRFREDEYVQKIPVQTVRYVEEQHTRMVKVPVLHWIEQEEVAFSAERPLVIRPKVYVPGQPIRNLIQAVTP